MPQIYDMGPVAILSLRRKACEDFFHPKNPMASAGFEPANLGTKGQHTTPRPPKPRHVHYVKFIVCLYICVNLCFRMLIQKQMKFNSERLNHRLGKDR